MYAQKNLTHDKINYQAKQIDLKWEAPIDPTIIMIESGFHAVDTHWLND
jgi:hypothetical protein